MHVTSNPYIGFHDDVFPAFYKNTVSQRRFPGSFHQKTIIPDNSFSSLEQLKHISTVEMKLDGTDQLQLEIEVAANYARELEIIECNFFDGTTFFLFGLCENGSFWFESDYFEERFIFDATGSDWKDLAFHISSTNSSNSSYFEVYQEKF